MFLHTDYFWPHGKWYEARQIHGNKNAKFSPKLSTSRSPEKTAWAAPHTSHPPNPDCSGTYPATSKFQKQHSPWGIPTSSLTGKWVFTAPVLIKQHNLLKKPRSPALKIKQPQQPSLREAATLTTHCISVNPFAPAIGANAPECDPLPLQHRFSVGKLKSIRGAEQAAGS